MGNIAGKFADQDSYVLSALIATSDNNQSDLNVIIQENDYLRASSVIFQQQGLTNTTANPVSNVTIAAQQTIGAALGGIDQPDTGGPCFLGKTLFTLSDGSYIKFSDLYENKHNYKWARSFDDDNHERPGEILDVFKNTVKRYVVAMFDDGSASEVVPEHRYFIPTNIYLPIKYLEGKDVMDEQNQPIKVTKLTPVYAPNGISVYNAHIKDYQNYCADKKRVHNVKPQGGNES